MTKQKYIFNKLIFRVTIGIMAVFVLIIGMDLGFKNYYYIDCPSETNGFCTNPISVCLKNNNTFEYIKNSCDSYKQILDYCKDSSEDIICNQSQIKPGESLGELPHFLVKNGNLILILIVILGFITNHILYNGDKNVLKNNIK